MATCMESDLKGSLGLAYMLYFGTCRNPRSPRHQPLGSYTQVYDEGLSVYSPCSATNLIQSCGHSQRWSVYFQVSFATF